MTPKTTKADAYINELPEDRKIAVQHLRKTVLQSLPAGFEETMSYGMIAFQVPLETYPAGYHAGKPLTPLPFINIASQKNHIALYHMGIYANPKILDWFRQEYPKNSTRKLDMGKSCIRFKKINDIPYDLIAELCGKISVAEWIETYETKSNARTLKNYFLALIGIVLLSSCNEKPVIVEDPRRNPEQFIKVDSLTSKELQVLKQDSYINDLDTNAGMEISQNRINMFYRTENDTINDYYNYTVDQQLNGKSTAAEGISYLHLIRGGDSLHYQILKNDRSVLRFKFVKDSTIHEYFPENVPGKAPKVIPD